MFHVTSKAPLAVYNVTKVIILFFRPRIELPSRNSPNRVRSPKSAKKCDEFVLKKLPPTTGGHC